MKKQPTYPCLTQTEKLRKEKDMDELQKQLISVISIYGLKTDEVAALLFSTMKLILSQKANKKMLKRKFKIDIDKLNAQGIFTVQHALLEAYVDKNKKEEAKVD